MDVKNSPAGHVTEKCAIRQMSFSTDDGNEYYEPAHLFTPQNKQNPPAPSGHETKLKTAATERLMKAKAGYTKAAQALIDALLPGNKTRSRRPRPLSPRPHRSTGMPKRRTTRCLARMIR